MVVERNLTVQYSDWRWWNEHDFCKILEHLSLLWCKKYTTTSKTQRSLVDFCLNLLLVHLTLKPTKIWNHEKCPKIGSVPPHQQSPGGGVLVKHLKKEQINSYFNLTGTRSCRDNPEKRRRGSPMPEICGIMTNFTNGMVQAKAAAWLGKNSEERRPDPLLLSYTSYHCGCFIWFEINRMLESSSSQPSWGLPWNQAQGATTFPFTASTGGFHTQGLPFTGLSLWTRHFQASSDHTSIP